MMWEHPTKTEESANQPEGCDAKLQGPQGAHTTASGSTKYKTQSVVPALAGWCGALLFLTGCGILFFGSIKQRRKIL